MQGLGEKFSPDLHTGTGNFTVPLDIPVGRNGFQPRLDLTYSTGHGNGPFGLGWSLGIPGVSRRTSRGIPRYDDAHDTFVVAGLEDLVPVPGGPPGANRYRPRTESAFSRIDRHRRPADDHWEVRNTDGSVSRYGTPGQAGGDPAVLRDPADPFRVFAWKLTETLDSFGNRIRYEYLRDEGDEGPHRWDQLYLHRIEYVDYPSDGAEHFLVSVHFDYGARPDPFSDYRAGFELRSRLRCTRIAISTHAGPDRLARTYELVYADQRPPGEAGPPPNSASLLSRILVVGHDGEQRESLPPLDLGYTPFAPDRRDFFPVTGPDLPTGALSNPSVEMVDLFGRGLPDLLQLNGSARYWRNLGEGRFDLPRLMPDAPAGLALGDPGVQLMDADGDGRTDLLISTPGRSGYHPLQFNGSWDRRSFQRHRAVPSFDLRDPEVRLVDLDGDGITDAIRSGARLECFFNDAENGWSRTRWVERRSLEGFPNVGFSDPRVRWADMTGDSLPDVVLVHDGNVEYWPSLGHGSWGRRIVMRHSPRFPEGYDPRRILLGDVDGDGLADLVYVDHAKVLLWINQGGNGWPEQPLVIRGTPPASSLDSVRLADLRGSGISGVLWSLNGHSPSRHTMFFLDFTGGRKPYLLDSMDNHMGAVTRVVYAPSSRFCLEDEKRPGARWKTPLPFPVQVVARVEVLDRISGGKLTTEYSYHHGYWDGTEREFRGFGRVDRLDSENFDDYNRPGAHGETVPFVRVDDRRRFSPPTLTRTWFHQGPVGAERGDWVEGDLSSEFWPGDLPLLSRTASSRSFLARLPRHVRRGALRSLRGRILRTELYALDGGDRQDRPYTVSEQLHDIRPLPLGQPWPAEPEPWRLMVFFPHLVAERTTQWERGDDPMTRFTFASDYDPYGLVRARTSVAVPRGRDPRVELPAAAPAEPYLVTRMVADYAQRDDAQLYIVDRVARTTTYEVHNDGRATVAALQRALEDGAVAPAPSLIGQTVRFYDGPAFTGLPFGQIGDFGALARMESLVLTDAILQSAYRSGAAAQPPERPPMLSPGGPPPWTAEYPLAFRNAFPAAAPDPTRPGLATTPSSHGYSAGGPGAALAEGYFTAVERRQYDFQVDPQGRGRGMVRRRRDARGGETALTHDGYDLFPTSVSDAAGLALAIAYDYRAWQVASVTDFNGNRTLFSFTPLGLPASSAVMGKPGEAVGDTAAEPGSRFSYDLLAFGERGTPPSARSRRRVHHVNDLDVPVHERDQTIETIEYSDGFGRLLQTRTLAEDLIFAPDGGAGLPSDLGVGPGDAVGRPRAAGEPPRVVVSGWRTYDNKGRVVEKYEPFFSSGWEYAAPLDVERGEKVSFFHDPRGQVLRRVAPDGSEQRTVWGVPANLAEPDRYRPTAWESFSFDANDNGGRTHPQAAAAHQHLWNTPASGVLDGLGRTVLTVERNGAQPAVDWFTTRSTCDIRGNLLALTDPLGRVAFRYEYDLADRPLRVQGLDSGSSRTVFDAAGNSLEARDGKGALVLRTYDVLGRPAMVWARDAAGEPLTLRERIVHGDDADSGLTAAQAAAANLRGRVHRHCDEAGVLTTLEVDVKGNTVERSRRVISDAAILRAGAPGAYRVDWEPPAGATPAEHEAAIVDPLEYRTSTRYDALGRVKEARYPIDVAGARRRLRARYNRAGLLEQVELDGTALVRQISYNAKGQRSLIAYGNGLMTRLAYDPRTFRLVRLRTERYVDPPPPLIYRPVGPPVQDLGYEYDLAGNLARLRDRTPGCGVAGAALGPDALDRVFAYGPVYRLLRATGRECTDIPGPRPWSDDPRCGFDSAHHGTADQDGAVDQTSTYEEEYAYDPAGNLVSLRHARGAGAWTRHFGVGGLTPLQWGQQWSNHLNAPLPWANPPGNRLTHVGDEDPNVAATHAYDGSGNLVSEAGRRHFEWDHANRLRAFRSQVGAAPPAVEVRYLYDASGQRAKKLARRAGGPLDSTVYLEGLFEHRRWSTVGGPLAQNNRLHVMDVHRRLALVRVGDAHPDDHGPAIQFHLPDHLDSASLVVDAAGGLINREEFTPYGESSFGGFGGKRYRFTGKERDEESGLSYHGARYYAPHLARWISPDPKGRDAGPNPYAYVKGNPATVLDPTGEDVEKSGVKDGRFKYTVNAGWIEIKHVREYVDKLITVHNSLEKSRKGEVQLVSVIPGLTSTERKTQTYTYDYSKAQNFDIKKASLEILYRAAFQEETDQGEGWAGRRWTAFGYEDVTSNMVGGLVGLEAIRLRKENPKLTLEEAKTRALDTLLSKEKLGAVDAADALRVFEVEETDMTSARGGTALIRGVNKSAAQVGAPADPKIRATIAAEYAKKGFNVGGFTEWTDAAAIASGKEPLGIIRKEDK